MQNDDFPSLAIRRQRKYWNAANPVQPTIISRSDSGTVQQDWYFSCGDNHVFLSGYRRYERDPAGDWFIAARWYPEVHALDNLILIEDVPFPDDVVKEAIERGYGRALPEGFEVMRSGQHVVFMAGELSPPSEQQEMVETEQNVPRIKAWLRSNEGKAFRESLFEKARH